jgi:hypothetical protein
MRFNHITIALTLACLFPLSATAQHADIKPNVQGGAIVTDGWIDATSELIPGFRVFGYDFQEDMLDPYVILDPGFNTVGASALPGGSQLILRVPSPTLFGLPANLTYWSGSGEVSFGAVPSGESLRLNRGTQDRIFSNNSSAIADFSIGGVGANGSIHEHLNSFLQGSDGNVDPGDGIVPADGVYLVPFMLASSDPMVADSLPSFLVYNNGVSEEVHDAAIDWVETNLVPIPEPATLFMALFGVTGVFVLRIIRCLQNRDNAPLLPT